MNPNRIKSSTDAKSADNTPFPVVASGVNSIKALINRFSIIVSPFGGAISEMFSNGSIVYDILFDTSSLPITILIGIPPCSCKKLTCNCDVVNGIFTNLIAGFVVSCLKNPAGGAGKEKIFHLKILVC